MRFFSHRKPDRVATLSEAVQRLLSVCEKQAGELALLRDECERLAFNLCKAQELALGCFNVSQMHRDMLSNLDQRLRILHCAIESSGVELPEAPVVRLN